MAVDILEKIKLVKRLAFANRPRDMRLVMRSAYCFLKVNITRKPVCKYLDISIGNECNMRCKHCFATSLREDSRPRLGLADYASLAADAYRMGCLHANLQGGEPLVIENLEEYIRIFRRAGIFTSLTTNGFALSDEWIRRLTACGLTKLIFSLDSMEPAEHDEFRNRPGAHQKVVEGIAMARDAGMSVSVNVTITRESWRSDGQRRLFDWLHAEKIPSNPILACPVGAWGDKKELLVGDGEAREIEEMRRKFGLDYRDIHSSWLKAGCGAVAEQVYITPYGDVDPCPFIQVSLGNLKTEKLSDIWRRAMAEGLYGRYNARCWAAQESAFVHDLQEVSGRYAVLPVPCDAGEGREFLARHWNDGAGRYTGCGSKL